MIKKSTPNTKKPKDTSWNEVSDWYNETLEYGKDTYQTEVVLPNILRLLALKKGEHVLDLACGQGFFSRKFFSEGAYVSGVDLAPNLIKIARENSPKDIHFYVAPAHKIPFVKNSSVNALTIILALQNIKEVGETLAECARVLTPDGRLLIVINHPVFRIPKMSDWGYDEAKKLQYRRVDQYLSDAKVMIDLNPHKGGNVQTVSFHHPLQFYFKMFAKNGLAVTRLEEWISHKKSQAGLRQRAEDSARKEIPMFMCLELKKLQ